MNKNKLIQTTKQAPQIRVLAGALAGLMILTYLLVIKIEIPPKGAPEKDKSSITEVSASPGQYLELQTQYLTKAGTFRPKPATLVALKSCDGKVLQEIRPVEGSDSGILTSEMIRLELPEGKDELYRVEVRFAQAGGGEKTIVRSIIPNEMVIPLLIVRDTDKNYIMNCGDMAR